MERLNKFLAGAGLGSRRRCDELIAAGRVTVDGVRVAAPGQRVEPGQTVRVDGRPVAGQEKVYWLLNKPKGYLCTNYDPAGRPRAIDLLLHVPQRIYTVGRLDEDSEGLLLLTNDGELAERLTHPRYGIDKTYHVQVAGNPAPDLVPKLMRGVWLSDGLAKARRARRLREQGKSTWLEIVLAEGKKREIRRILARLGHKVLSLKRIALGPVKLDRLKTGKCRRLSLRELGQLERLANLPRSETKTPSAAGKGR
jgi:23S rRNA pseudouridine2605 synthase